jgi:chromosomal replication initiator protein DnaA
MSQYQLSAPETKEIWQQMLSDFKNELTDAVFSTWVINNPLVEINLEGDDQAICTFISPTAFHSQNIQKNLAPQYTKKLDDLLGRKSILKFKIGTPKVKELGERVHSSLPTHIGQTIGHTKPGTATQQNTNQDSRSNLRSGQQSFQSPNKQTNKKSSLTETKNKFFANKNQVAQGAPQSPRVEDLFSAANMESASMDRVKVTARNIGLRNDYTFETFAVSGTNELAHAAATAVSQRPGTAYNPLFIYGGVGVGKTHLMHAIGNNIIHNDPNTKIIYCTGEEFTNEIINAIKTKKAIGFKHKYRQAQVLLIDDVQFIAGKNTVQEEFFHTFNALTQQQSQVVLTSDKPPHEINLLEDRLRSRFEAGLMIDIGQPTFELRTAILLIKAQANNLNIPIQLAQTIASPSRFSPQN